MASLFNRPASRMVSASMRPHRKAMVPPARKLREFTSDGRNPMCGKEASAVRSKVVMSWLVTWYRCDRIPSTTPGAEPPRDARDSGSARSHSTHLETSPSDRPKMVTYMETQTISSYMSVTCTQRTLRMPTFTHTTHVQPSLSDFPWRDSDFWRSDQLTQDNPGGTTFSHFPPK